MEYMGLREAIAPDSLSTTARDERSFDRLARLGIVAWEQVLLFLPTGYHDYTKINTLLPRGMIPAEKACYRLTVTSKPNKAAIEPPRVTFNVSDGSISAKLTVFGNVWNWMLLAVGDQIIVEGQIELWEGRIQINNPTLIPHWMSGKVVPIYRGKRGKSRVETITPEFVLDKTRDALQSSMDGTVDYLIRHFPGLTESSIINQAGIQFPSLRLMLMAIHAPKSVAIGERGLEAARSLAAFELVFKARQQSIKKPNPTSVVNIHQKDVDALISRFPYQLTDDQKNGITEIVRDLRLPYPMQRLLSGDVGYGKTDVALIPALAAHMAGAKVVISCPSMLIVEQWIEKISSYGMGKFPILKVTGNAKYKPEELKERLKGNPVLVGTSALVKRIAEYKWIPDFTIIDEQQKHGKTHKDVLTAVHTNVLEATATCQPRTAALVYYGGMAETILNQSPVQKKIVTRIVTSTDKSRMFAHMKRVLEEMPDAQFAVVYPKLSKGDEKNNLLDAASSWEKHFPGQTGILHGKLSDQEKSDVIDRMKKNKIRVLLSTILIETGITIPSLRGMVVIGANMMGVSQLHQLRGRLARHGGKGYFYMYLPEQIDEESFARLNLLVEHTDGFVLAEKDAEMRGYGSLDEDETDQSGVSSSGMFIGMRLMPNDISRVIEAS